MKQSLTSKDAKLTLEGVFVRAEVRGATYLFPLASLKAIVLR